MPRLTRPDSARPHVEFIEALGLKMSGVLSMIEELAPSFKDEFLDFYGRLSSISEHVREVEDIWGKDNGRLTLRVTYYRGIAPDVFETVFDTELLKNANGTETPAA